MVMMALLLALAVPALAQLRPEEVKMLQDIEAREAAEKKEQAERKAEQDKRDSDAVQREHQQFLKSERCSVNPYWPDCKK